MASIVINLCVCVCVYRGEFLAVRNAESGFFLCQTLQNVYKSSPRIRIRWLSEVDKTDDEYELDFYDATDIECVLTTLELSRARADKSNYRLSAKERERIENILRKAIDVEKGVLPHPDVTEENPDGRKLHRLELKIFFRINTIYGVDSGFVIVQE